MTSNNITDAGQVVRHKKRGGTYEVIGTGAMQCTDWIDMHRNMFADSVDMRPVVIYRAHSDGSLWVRPVAEFSDGRFEIVADGIEKQV